jgi:hypothetical protein
MDQDIEELIARASDSRWIPAIHNYCDRRCARCRFNDRCFAFDEEARQGVAEDIADVVSRSLDRTHRLLRAYAEEAGIDFTASIEEDESAEASARDTLHDDPLVVAAHHYATESWKLLNALESQVGAGALVDVRDAIDSLQWLSTMIAPKVHRALGSLVDPLSPDDHPTQNDAHGSAETARLMIADSLAAWRVVNEFGQAAADSPTRALAARLERIDQDLAARIPRAMEFVRPGFDEPIPGVVRPWSLTAEDEPGDRRFLAASRIVEKLKDFARGLMPRFRRPHDV